LYSILSRIRSPEKNIVTIEDPVEYQIEGINQIQANFKIGLSFARGLRAVLRQDPDIIMVGEIRDQETAEISIRSALTGHLVFSTLHTNDAVGTLIRLINMGI
jgi:type IV pilus assembly protein PilB